MNSVEPKIRLLEFLAVLEPLEEDFPDIDSDLPKLDEPEV